MTLPASPMTVTPFSAVVTLALDVDGRVFELAQVGPGEAVLRNPEPVATGPATVIVTIDGRRRTSPVRITGQEADGRTVTLSRS